MNKKLLALILCITMAFAMLLTSCGNSQSSSSDGNDSSKTEETWKLAHTESKDGIYNMYAEKFAELVSKESDGRIKVEIHPVGELGDSAAQLEMIQNGGLDIAIFASGDVGSTFKQTQALSLNYLFSDSNKVNDAVLTKGKATKRLSKAMEKKNIKVYDWFSLGNMQWTSNKKITKLTDFKGFKMRIMDNPLISANYKAFGATPTPVAFTETYSALQTGTVDGTEQPLNAIEEMKFYEVQNYIIMSNHAQLASFVAMNKEFYGNLSSKDKKILDKIKPEMEKYALTTLNSVLDRKYKKILEEKPDMKVVELTDAQKASFRKASMKVRKNITKYAGNEGKTIMELAIKDVVKYEKKYGDDK